MALILVGSSYKNIGKTTNNGQRNLLISKELNSVNVRESAWGPRERGEALSR